MKTKKHYTPEFKAEAVKMIREQDLSHEEAAKRLGIPKGTLANWVALDKERSGAKAPGKPSTKDLEEENRRLRKELAEARQEREILKKAAAYFAKESL